MPRVSAKLTESHFPIRFVRGSLTSSQTGFTEQIFEKEKMQLQTVTAKQLTKNFQNHVPKTTSRVLLKIFQLLDRTIPNT